MMAEDPARRRLGRGLASLLGDNGAVTATASPSAPDRRPPRKLPIALLRPNPRNPRRAFDEAELAELVASVRERGVVQAILVRPVPGGGEGYEIIAGERRWRAAQKAGLHEVPVAIHEVSDREALELAIIENVQRADLNAIEEAQGYQQLIDDHQYSQSQLADVIGKSRPHIANTLRLMKLPEPVQAYVRAGKLSAGHARALVTLDDPETLARRIVEEGMSVREAEALGTAGRKKPAQRAPETKSADTRALEKQIADVLGLEVTISDGPKGGDVRIRYRTLEQLDDICRRLKA
jgi:ParB family chromosome partitioning protein